MYTQAVLLVEVFINRESIGLFTPDAYLEFRLQLSSGDYACHTIKAVVVHDPHPDSFTDLDILLFQLAGDI